jgi:hypothetical protein
MRMLHIFIISNPCYLALLLSGNLTQRDLQGLGDALAISRTSLQAVACMADLNLAWRTTNRMHRILE